MQLKNESVNQKVNKIFNYLHKHPEISWEEKNTTQYVRQLLKEGGCRIRTFDHTGVIAEIGEGKPVVAIRADMDALWQEVDGEFQPNHSCGHDAHMAMVLGVLFSLNSLGSLPKGTIRFIFQPAEEKGTGALQFVEEQVVDDVDYLYGVHLRPVQELRSGKATPAILHGSGHFIEGKIVGDDVHGARPHLGQNAIEIGATIVQLINGIHLDPMVSHSAKMTSFHAGGQSQNIIPGNATFGLDLRAQTNDVMASIVEAVEQRVKSVELLYGVQILLETKAQVPAAQVHLEAQHFMECAVKEVLGKENMEAPLVTTGGDDFHFYTIKRPHLKATMLGLGCDLSPGLHHPKMTFNHEALFEGVSILTKALLLTLEKGSWKENVSNQKT